MQSSSLSSFPRCHSTFLNRIQHSPMPLSRRSIFSSFWLWPFPLFLQYTTSLSLDLIDATVLEHAVQLGAPAPSCATLENYPGWFQPSHRFDVDDCLKALSLFHADYVRDHRTTKYEYLSSGVHPVHGIATQRLPIKSSHGKLGSWTQRVPLQFL